MAMRGEWIDAGTTRLYVRRWGPSDGQPVVFFHSLGPAASGALIDVGVGRLADAGYAIAAPDMPGFGQSPPLEADNYAVDRLARLGLALADRLGWERFVLGGHSWGGSVAVHLAAAAPERVRALVLVDSGHLDYGDDPSVDPSETLEDIILRQEERRHRAADRAGVARDLALAVDDPVVDSFLEGTMDDGEGGLITRTLPATRGAAIYHLMRARQSDQWPELAASAMPILLLLATKPPETRERNEAAGARFRAGVPQADVRLVDGATHSLITDIRARFGEIVRDWLADLELSNA